MYGFEFFDAGLNRLGTESEKWDMARETYGEHILPMWVADMDFESPREVRDSILARAAHPTYGYTEPNTHDTQALIAFWQRRHGLTIQQHEVMLMPCVISAMKLAVQTFTNEGDGIVVQPPVYGQFYTSVLQNGRRLIENPLVQGADGRYSMNLDELETLFKNGAKMLLLCSPHNPVSRVWSEQEISQVTALAKRYDVVVVSDEIHADFVYAPNRFTSVLHTGHDNLIMLCAASKTFNLAGLLQASLVTPNQDYYARLEAKKLANGLRQGNTFALCGTRAAYQHGDAWLDGLKTYLEKGRSVLLEEIKREIPRAKVVPIEATYLAFIDLRDYGMSCEQLQEKCTRAGVLFTLGTYFSQTYGEGFVRMNFACPHRFIVEGIKRLKNALAE